MGSLSKAPRVFYGITFGCMLVFSLALLCTHTVFMEMFGARGVYVPVGMDMIQTECSLTSVNIIETTHSNGHHVRYAAQWNGYVPYKSHAAVSIILNPLSQRFRHVDAVLDANSRNLSSTYPCECPPTIWSVKNDVTEEEAFYLQSCSLDMQVMSYLDQEASRYGYAETSLVGIGICCLIFSLLGLAMLLWDTDCFWSCCNACKKRASTLNGNYRAYFEVGNEDDDE